MKRGLLPAHSHTLRMLLLVRHGTMQRELHTDDLVLQPSLEHKDAKGNLEEHCILVSASHERFALLGALHVCELPVL